MSEMKQHHDAAVAQAHQFLIRSLPDLNTAVRSLQDSLTTIQLCASIFALQPSAEHQSVKRIELDLLTELRGELLQKRHELASKVSDRKPIAVMRQIEAVDELQGHIDVMMEILTERLSS